MGLFSSSAFPLTYTYIINLHIINCICGQCFSIMVLTNCWRETSYEFWHLVTKCGAVSISVMLSHPTCSCLSKQHSWDLSKTQSDHYLALGSTCWEFVNINPPMSHLKFWYQWQYILQGWVMGYLLLIRWGENSDSWLKTQ